MIAVAAMGMVEVPGNQIVHMVAVRHRFMSAVRTVNVVRGVAGAFVARRTVVGIGSAHGNRMLIVVVAMMVVQVAIVQKINMVFMNNTGVAAARTVNVHVVGIRMDDV